MKKFIYHASILENGIHRTVFGTLEAKDMKEAEYKIKQRPGIKTIKTLIRAGIDEKERYDIK